MSTSISANDVASDKKVYFPRLYAALPFLALFLLMMVINWQVTYYPDNDDAYYLAITQDKSFGEFISFRYSNWTGRLFAEVLHYGIFSGPLITWKFLNTCMIVLLAFSWAVLLFSWGFWRRLSRGSLLTLWFLCAALGWISHPVLVAAAFWVTGSLDYLWPLVLATFALIPFVERLIHANRNPDPLPAWFYPLSGLAGICACLGVEQATFILVGAGALCVLYLFFRERRLDVGLSALFLVFVLASVFSITSPGNFVRYQVEMGEYPEFANYSLQKRIYMTIAWMLESVFFRSRMLTILLMGFTLALSARLPGARLQWLRALMAAFTLLLAVSATNWLEFNKPGGEKLTEVLFTFQTPDMMIKDLARYGLSSVEFWLNQAPLLIWGSALIVTMILLHNLGDLTRPYNGQVCLLLLGLGLGALFLVSLSPTIYASGPRTTFAYNLIQIFIIAAVFKSLSKNIPTLVIAFLYLFPVINLLLIGNYLTGLR